MARDYATDRLGVGVRSASRRLRSRLFGIPVVGQAILYVANDAAAP
jgi:hypothetical protein